MSLTIFPVRLRQAVLCLSWSACGAVALPLAGGLLLPTRTLAQASQIITGRVTSQADKEGLLGVTILEKGTSNGVSTNSDGTFTLKTSAGSTLVISSVGYVTQQVTATAAAMSVALVSDSKELNDVVVVGYGSVKKSDLTGSVSSLKRDELLIGNPLSLDRGLQGKVAGVQVTQNDGAPGSGISIQIRGINSFSGSTQPLYVIDGVPLEINNTQSTASGSTGIQDNAVLSTNALNFLRPADIESIEVLKDASATAIYGSRGSNGVVIITTKKGVSGKDRVDVTLRTAFDQVNKRLKLLDAETYANYANESNRNADIYYGTNIGAPNQLPFPGLTDPITGIYKPAPADFRGKGTDWQDVIFQTGHVYDANVSLSGGGDKGNYVLSGSYIKQGGIIANSNFEQGGIRFNGSRTLSKWLSFETNTQTTRSLNKLVRTAIGTTGSDGGVINAAIRFAPTYDLNQNNYTAVNVTEQPVTNPYIYTTDVKNQNLVSSIFSSNSLIFKILPGFTARTRLGLNYYDARRDVYYPRTTYEGIGVQGIGTVSSYNQFDITSENILTYTKKLAEKHNLTAVAGYTYTTSDVTSQSNTVSGFANDALQDNNLGAATKVNPPSSGRSSTTLLSYLGRVNYDFNSKYLFTLTGRIDGSSKFARNKKYAAFGAAAFAWRAVDEEFIKNLNVFSDLKVRLSYGSSGSQAIGAYQSLARIQANTYPVNGQLVNGYAQVSAENPDLTWETTYQGDVGLDVAFFDGRLSLTADYYNKKTENLLQNLTLPTNAGFGSILFNSGSVRNKGVEAALSVRAVDGANFKWTASGNISINRNELLSLGAGKLRDFSERISAGPEARPFIYLPGQALGLIYGYQEDGIFQNADQVKAFYPNLDGPATKKLIGEIRYKDLNGDGQINDAGDRTIIGNVNPKFVYGVNNNFTFKAFDLGIFFQGSVGNDIINYTHFQTDNLGKGGNTTQKAYDNRWTPDNPNATNPKAANEYSRQLRFSDRFIESGTYFRIKTLSAGYNFNFQQYGVRTARLFASATNLFTATNYSGYDPEVNAYGNDPSRRGVDLANYPNSRSYSVGINVGF